MFCCVEQAPDENSLTPLAKWLEYTVALFLGKITSPIHRRDVGGNGTERKNMLALSV